MIPTPVSTASGITTAKPGSSAERESAGRGVVTPNVENRTGSAEGDAGKALMTPPARRVRRRPRYGSRSGSRSRSASVSISDEAYLNKHLAESDNDERATQVVPPTTGVAVPVKSEKTQGAQGRSLKRNIKATVLTFRAIVDRPHVARVQLLLCNISDRALYFKLKSNVGSNVSALPAGNAEIPPHAQVRLVLTWTRPPQYEHWRDVPPPKLLIVTRFLDEPDNEGDSSATAIRLIIEWSIPRRLQTLAGHVNAFTQARVSSSKTCFASNPPVEQLLLDAMGKATMEVSSVLPERSPRSSEKTSEQQVTPASQTGKDLADFFNQLDEKGLLFLIVVVICVTYILSRMLDKKNKRGDENSRD